MTLPYPNSPDKDENIGQSITRIEQNLEYLDGQITTTQFKMVYKLYDMGTTNGATDITGVGFKPTAIVCFATETNNDSQSWGVYANNTERCVYKDYNEDCDEYAGFIYLKTGAATSMDGLVITTGDDGFTIDFGRTGTSGNMSLIFLCMR